MISATIIAAVRATTHQVRRSCVSCLPPRNTWGCCQGSSVCECIVVSVNDRTRGAVVAYIGDGPPLVPSPPPANGPHRVARAAVSANIGGHGRPPPLRHTDVRQPHPTAHRRGRAQSPRSRPHRSLLP